MSDAIYIMQYNYLSRYLVPIDVENEMKFHENEAYKYKESLLTIKRSEIFIAKSRICKMTARLGARGFPEFDGNAF